MAGSHFKIIQKDINVPEFGPDAWAATGLQTFTRSVVEVPPAANWSIYSSRTVAHGFYLRSLPQSLPDSRLQPLLHCGLNNRPIRQQNDKEHFAAVVP